MRVEDSTCSGWRRWCDGWTVTQKKEGRREGRPSGSHICGGLWEELVFEGGGGEIAAGGGGVRFGVVDDEDVVAGDVELALECADELGEPADLGGCWHGAVKVADDADADAGGVDLVGAGRGRGGLLVGPALADLDLTVDGSVAVTDEEVVAEAVVLLGEGDGVAGSGLGVVDVDVLPAVGDDIGFGLEDNVEIFRRVDGEEGVGFALHEGGGGECHEGGAREGEDREEACEDD